MLMVITSYYNDRLKLWKMIHIIHHLSVKYDVHAIIFVMSVTGCRVSSSSWYADICGTSQVVPREPPHHFKLMHYSHSLEWVTLASADCRPLNITNFINKKNGEYVINNTDCSASFSELVLYIQCIILWHQKMVLLSQQLQEIAHTIPLNTSDHLILFCFYYYPCTGYFRLQQTVHRARHLFMKILILIWGQSHCLLVLLLNRLLIDINDHTQCCAIDFESCLMHYVSYLANRWADGVNELSGLVYLPLLSLIKGLSYLLEWGTSSPLH